MKTFKTLILSSLVIAVVAPAFADYTKGATNGPSSTIDGSQTMSAEEQEILALKEAGLSVPEYLYELVRAQHGIVPVMNYGVRTGGGEDIGTAEAITGLPFSDAGSTANALDDYDEQCPYTGSTSPDVVYSYAPAVDEIVDITLCNGSSYDTKLYVYENVATPGLPFACNDDTCPGYVSELPGLSLIAGNTYFIVVDGYGGNSGDYVIDVAGPTGPVPCDMVCDVQISEPVGSFMGEIVNSGDAVWYCITGADCLMEISTCNEYTEIDSKLELWYNDPVLGCVLVADDDDDGSTLCSFGGLKTTLGNEIDDMFTMIGGGEYYIKVFAYNTGTGVYQLDLRGCDIVEAVDGPVAFDLKQNYPNPFNPTTTIDFSIENTDMVNLSVYSLSGQKVATLVNGMVESGSHSVTFDASNISSGVYFYTLNADGVSATSKMILMK
jgi:hypothetical protein